MTKFKTALWAFGVLMTASFTTFAAESSQGVSLSFDVTAEAPCSNGVLGPVSIYNSPNGRLSARIIHGIDAKPAYLMDEVLNLSSARVSSDESGNVFITSGGSSIQVGTLGLDPSQPHSLQAECTKGEVDDGVVMQNARIIPSPGVQFTVERNVQSCSRFIGFLPVHLHRMVQYTVSVVAKGQTLSLPPWSASSGDAGAALKYALIFNSMDQCEAWQSSWTQVNSN